MKIMVSITIIAVIIENNTLEDNASNIKPPPILTKRNVIRKYTTLQIYILNFTMGGLSKYIS